MTPLKRWDPCLAGMARDVAFFDGITVETDRITDPRWDRVLGILEEEQVFMCRMMAPLLEARLAAKVNLLVVDIGTGSGVFALYAAKLGCAVVAIDISERALRFARENARTNKINVSAGPPRPGEIQFLNCGYEDLSGDGSFDVVIISPPYNPTVDGFFPALHAKAGELGQTCFEDQLPHVARLLKRDGVCIGNQMMVVDGVGHFEAVPKLQRYFPGGEFQYIRILSRDIRVEDFMRGQYATYLKQELKLKPGPAAIVGHIQAHAGERSFALVYFELMPGRGESVATGIADIALKETIDSARPPQSWRERVALHRRIVEHTSLEHSFPAPALFLETDGVPDFPGNAPDGDGKHEHWSTSVLSHVDTWLAKAEFLDEKEGKFDLILVDTAPWYPTPEGRAGLSQESAVWVAASPAGGMPTTDPAAAKRFLALYQDNTLRLQNTKIGPFLHPHFTGKSSPTSWRAVQFTVMERAANETREGAREPQTRLTPEAQVIEHLLGKLNAAPVDPANVARMEGEAKRAATAMHGVQSWFMQQSLADLDVPANKLRQYAEDVERRVQQVKLNGAGAGAAGEMLKSLDLDFCHQAMHRRLDELVESAGMVARGSSTLIGIPVSMGSSNTNPSEYGLPDSYRGGIWIYAVARTAWRPREERDLLDLARLLYMLYEGRYAQLAGKELLRLGRDQARFDSSHEVKHLVQALREWPQDLAAFGLMDVNQGAAATSEEGDYAIVPFRKLFDAGLAYVQMWAMAGSESDLPFYRRRGRKLPQTVAELISECFSSAKEGFLIRLFRKYPVLPQWVGPLRHTYAALEGAMPKLEVSGTGVQLAPGWQGERVGFWLNLSRLLLCEFREALQHGVWTCEFGITVRVDADAGEITRVEFFNVRGKGGSEANFEANIRGLTFDPLISRADVIDAFTAAVSYGARQGGTGGYGTGVRAGLAKELNAKMSFRADANDHFGCRYDWGSQ